MKKLQELLKKNQNMSIIFTYDKDQGLIIECVVRTTDDKKLVFNYTLEEGDIGETYDIHHFVRSFIKDTKEYLKNERI